MKNGASSFLLHKDKESFRDLVDRTATRAGFYTPLMEKDYYLTFILSKINELSPDLIFKGGTCLNKIYYSYYRLSEDLDFSLRIPVAATRGNRRKAMQTIKNNIEAFSSHLGFRLVGADQAGRNESRQYIYYFEYDAVTIPAKQTIKLEISLRFNPLLATEARQIQHQYVHPFTGASLLDAGTVNCLALNEIVSEKLRAAALRKDIAPRDFYDLDFILRNKFNLANRQVMDLFRQKLIEDGGDADLTKIKDMRSRVKEELFEVLTRNEKDKFDLDRALKRINNAMESFVDADNKR